MKKLKPIKAIAPNEKILIHNALNYTLQVIIDEQRSGRPLEDEFQELAGKAIEDLPDLLDLLFPEINTSKKSERAQAQAQYQQTQANEAKAELDLEDSKLIPEINPSKKPEGEISKHIAEKQAQAAEAKAQTQKAEAKEAKADQTKADPEDPKLDKHTLKYAKILKKKKIRRARERVTALLKIKKYLEDMLKEEK